MAFTMRRFSLGKRNGRKIKQKLQFLGCHFTFRMLASLVGYYGNHSYWSISDGMPFRSPFRHGANGCQSLRSFGVLFGNSVLHHGQGERALILSNWKTKKNSKILFCFLHVSYKGHSHRGVYLWNKNSQKWIFNLFIHVNSFRLHAVLQFLFVILK